MTLARAARRPRRTRADCQRRASDTPDEHGRDRRRRRQRRIVQGRRIQRPAEDRARSAIGNFDLRGSGAYDSTSALRWRVTGHRPRSRHPQRHRRRRRRRASSGSRSAIDELRRNRSDTLPDAVQRHRHGRADAARHVAGPDRGRQQRHQQRRQRPERERSDPGDWSGAVSRHPRRPRPRWARCSRRPLRRRTGRRRGRGRPARVPQRRPLHERARGSTPASTTTSTTDGDSTRASGPSTRTGLKPMGTGLEKHRRRHLDHHSRPDRHNHNQIDTSLNFKGGAGASRRPGTTARSSGTTCRPCRGRTGRRARPGRPGTSNTMSSAPEQRFNQINATAGSNLVRDTKLVANGSYARNTQNDPFLTDATTPVVPVTLAEWPRRHHAVQREVHEPGREEAESDRAHTSTTTATTARP